jgi:membrane-associated phospholipid phosphatase
MIVGAALCWLAFLAVTGCIMIAGSFPGDRGLLIELHEVVGTSMDDPMIAVDNATNTGPLVGLAVVLAVVLLSAGRRMDALFLLLGLGVSCVLNPALKEVVERARPDVWESPVSVSQYSFPSGHAANTAALVGGLLMIVRPERRRLAVAVGGLVLAVVAFSQLALGVHYPSDLVAGWLWVGAFTTLLWSTR